MTSGNFRKLSRRNQFHVPDSSVPIGQNQSVRHTDQREEIILLAVSNENQKLLKTEMKTVRKRKLLKTGYVHNCSALNRKSLTIAPIPLKSLKFTVLILRKF